MQENAIYLNARKKAPCGNYFVVVVKCLPDLSVEIADKARGPCKVANEAVFNHDLRATLQENEEEAEDTETDDGSEADDDDDEHEIQLEDGKNERNCCKESDIRNDINLTPT
ncbi:Hypothetical predicted protein [Paramuricea clavata]|uniref:Uncharacterized protein n=1 Tax=Paramuricea clavata TaxID=317549 RepID=A0A7D9JCB5_PARCT|nr:Hypothetical predicted protein [Paramuricea clavata]